MKNSPHHAVRGVEVSKQAILVVVPILWNKLLSEIRLPLSFYPYPFT